MPLLKALAMVRRALAHHRLVERGQLRRTRTGHKVAALRGRILLAVLEVVGRANGVPDLMQHILHVATVWLPSRAAKTHVCRLHQSVGERHVTVIEVASCGSNVSVEVELTRRNSAMCPSAKRLLLHL